VVRAFHGIVVLPSVNDMPDGSVTHVSEQLLPISPVYTMGEDRWG